MQKLYAYAAEKADYMLYPPSTLRELDGTTDFERADTAPYVDGTTASTEPVH